MAFSFLPTSLLLLLLLLLVDPWISAAPESALITHLPGFNGTFPSKHYAGYVTVDEDHGRNLFYYFVVSEGNPSKDPVVLWLNGGPGKKKKRKMALGVKPNLGPGAAGGEEGRILWSDVVVKKPGRRGHWRRKWKVLDVEKAVAVLLMHVLCLFAPFTFRWGALWTAVVLYVITGLLGITLSYHRNLTHRSFTLPKWLEYSFAYCGVLALQTDPMDWVSAHRYHHQYTDSDRDPHSPSEGFWFSHMEWIFDKASLLEKCGRVSSNVADLAKQPFYRFIRRTYVAHPIALALLLYKAGGFPYLVWGMGVRTVWVYHITWFVNSACHVWGSRHWNTDDLSRNNWWVAMLSFGEGWHNNHHAFQYSARHGLEWWEVDMTWYVVRLLEVLGLATDVKLPSKLHMQRMSLGADFVHGDGGGSPKSI